MKNPYKVAAISAIVTIVTMIIFVFLMIFWVSVYQNIYLVYFIIPFVSILMILFYMGIHKIGVDYSSNIIKIGMKIRIAIIIIGAIVGISFIAYYQQNINDLIKSFSNEAIGTEFNEESAIVSTDLENIEEQNIETTQTPIEKNEEIMSDDQSSMISQNSEAENFFSKIPYYYLIFIIIYIIIGVLPDILVGFGMIKIPAEKIKYAKTTGIIGLIYGFGSALQGIITVLLVYAAAKSAVFFFGGMIFNNLFGYAISMMSIVWFIFILIVLFGEAKKLDQKKI